MEELEFLDATAQGIGLLGKHDSTKLRTLLTQNATVRYY